MKKIRQLLIALLACLMAITAGAVELPDLGNPDVTSLTPQQEAKMTKAFLQMLRKQTQFVSDPIINNYLHNLGYRLVSQTGTSRQRFRFFMIHNPEINAFAGPGGYIGMFSGLFLITRSENELAAVLSHEVAHVTQHHLARTYGEAKRLSLPSIGAMLAAVLIGAKTNSPDAAIGMASAISAGAAQHMISFTRSNESEADRVGMRILYNARFDPRAIPELFARMQRANFNYDYQIPAFLKTHPVTPERISDAQAKLAHYPKRKVSSSLNYYLIRARLRVVVSNSGRAAAHYFKTQLDKHTTQNKQATQYGYALALLKARELAAAKKMMSHLIAQHPNQMLYPMGLAEIMTTQQDIRGALALLKRNYPLYPDYYPLLVQYVDLLLKSGHARQAYPILQQQIPYYSSNAVIYLMYAQAQSKTGHTADAYISRARAIELLGNPTLAIDQLQQAFKHVRHNDRDKKAIILARIKTLQLKVRNSGKRMRPVAVQRSSGRPV